MPVGRRGWLRRHRRLCRRNRRLDVVDQRVGKLQPAGQQIEIAALGPRIRVDRQPRSGVKFDLLRFGLGRRDQRVEIERRVQFLASGTFRHRRRCRRGASLSPIFVRSSSSIWPSAFAAAIMARTSASVNSASPCGACAGWKPVSAGGGSSSGSPRPLSRRLLALLVVLVGLVGQAADCRETAELHRRAGDLAPRTGAEKHGDKRAGGKRIVLGKLRRLPRLVAHGDSVPGHLRTEQVVEQLLGIEHQGLQRSVRGGRSAPVRMR